MKLFRFIAIVLLSFSCILSTNAAVWQYSAQVPGGIHHSGTAKAYLWIPPNCTEIRAIVFAQNNMEEISILENPVFREQMRELGVAEIWASPPFNLQFMFNSGAGESFNAMIDTLVKKSGYEELKTAPVSEYKGDPNEAFWFFDKEHMDATRKYQAKHRSKKVPLLGYIQNNAFVVQKNTHQQVDLDFQPLKDGITFLLKADFVDTVPGGSPRPANWTGLPAGSVIEKPGDKENIIINKICGPFIHISGDTFRLSMEKGIGDKMKNHELWFSANYPGNKTFKPAVQQAKMGIPLETKAGIEQQIDFPQIPNQTVVNKTIKLLAKASSGLPVGYYVESGPAIITNNEIQLTAMPVKSKYPIEITVVAWQYGANKGKLYQTAQPVSRLFYIIK